MEGNGGDRALRVKIYGPDSRPESTYLDEREECPHSLENTATLDANYQCTSMGGGDGRVLSFLTDGEVGNSQGGEWNSAGGEAEPTL